MKKTWVFCDNSDFNKRILVNPSQVKLINNSLVGQFFLRAHFPNVTRVNKKGETVFVVRDQFFRMDTKKKVNAKNLSLILPELRKYQNEVYDEYFVTKGAQLKTTS